jgi:hypothetical protein
VLHEYSLKAGALAAIAEQFNGVLALHAIILAEARLGEHPAEIRPQNRPKLVARIRLLRREFGTQREPGSTAEMAA